MSIIYKRKQLARPGMPRKHGGFTLLEALIGFLILSIGMLGIASLQAISLKAGKTSVYNSVVVMKIEELMESMRANPTSLASYVGAGANNSCETNVCTAVQLAQDDIFWWKENLKAGLPNTADTTTVIAVQPAMAPSRMATVTITINWKERNKSTSGGGSVDKSYSATTGICTANPC